MKTIYTLLALFMSMGLFAQEELTSFRGWEWGTSYNELESQLTPADTRTTLGMKPFHKIDEELNFEGIDVDNIIYLFKRNKFVAATVAMHNDHLDEIIKVFTEKYGEPKVVEAFVLTNHEWHIPTADIVITKIPSASNGIGVSVQIKGK
ncbi:MAG: hypothetical protein PF436_10520 [Prolixibacteraceae bacterium]|nr:hypothetical protein [Prolixibacteraceae bacterium]